MAEAAATEKVPLSLHLGYFAMVIGMFMAILDVQIVASSISQIQAGVAASSEEIAWVQTGYLIAEVVGIPLSGFLNRVFGLKRLFIYSCAGFTASSILCAMAWDLDSLIFFRIIQGFIGAAMLPTTMAAAFTLFPGGRSLVQQVMVSMVATLAPAIGPTLGGYVTETLSWHWLFLINVIPGIIACLAVWALIPEQKSEPSLLKRIDLIGLGAMALMLGSFEWVVEEGPLEGWFDSGSILLWTFICLSAAFVFFYRSLTVSLPIVDLRVFKNRNFASGAAVAVTIGFGLYGVTYALPFFLGQVKHLSAMQIGHIMSVSGAAMVVGGPIAGILTSRMDPRFVIGIGLALLTLGVWGNTDLTRETGFNELFWPQVFRGTGLIITMVPTSQIALGLLKPEQVANASGIFTVVRNLGGAIGIAVLNTLMGYYYRLHEQEIAAGLDPARPEVQAYLAGAAEGLRSAGVADPELTARAQLEFLAKQEALVMTYNNVFVFMTLTFLVAFACLFLLQRPPPRAVPVRAEH